MNEKRKNLDLSGSVMDTIILMSEGNPGAITVLMKLIANPLPVLILDEMNIRGEQIWIGYKDFCKQDIDKFKEAIFSRDENMINTINKECPNHTAVKNRFKL